MDEWSKRRRFVVAIGHARFCGEESRCIAALPAAFDGELLNGSECVVKAAVLEMRSTGPIKDRLSETVKIVNFAQLSGESLYAVSERMTEHARQPSNGISNVKKLRHPALKGRSFERLEK